MVCATKLGSFYLYDLLNGDDTGIEILDLNYWAIIKFKKPDYEKYPANIH